MRKVSLFLIVAAVAAASFTKPAIALEPSGQDKAAEVLATMRKAIGNGKLDTLKTFSLEAKTARNMANGQLLTDIEMYLELPDKYLRVDNITAPIARTVQSGFNADKVIRNAGGGAPGAPMMINGAHVEGGGQRQTVTIMSGGGGTASFSGASGGAGNTPPTPEQVAMMNANVIRSQRVELSRYLIGWFGMAHPGLNATYTYAGEAESPDGKAHIIDVKADGGFAAKLFIDQATNLPLMVSYTGLEPITFNQRGGGPGAPAGAPVVSPGTRGGGAGAPPAGTTTTMPTQEEMQTMMANRKTIEYRIFFTDWKEVDGIKFPHALQRATAGTTTEEWTIAKVKVNPKLDAKKFATQ